MDSFIFYISEEFDPDKILQKIDPETGFSIRFEQIDSVEGELLDNFTHELYRSGKILAQTLAGLTLVDVAKGAISTQDLPEKVRNWKFPADLDGIVAEALKGTSALRSFSTVTQVRLQEGSAILVDDEEKTRVRLSLLTLVREGKSVCLGMMETLRGYEDDADLLREWLAGAGAVPAQGCRGIYKSLGLAVPTYTSKPDIILHPHSPAKESARAIIEAHIEVARMNEPGVIADRDTEFLHDYRVALRKVRSVLSLFKGVYSEKDTERMKTAVADVMKSTNRMRDLDVFLLNRKVYLNQVPETARPGLELVFEKVSRERELAFTEVVKVLQSKAYKQKFSRLTAHFSAKSRLRNGLHAREPSLEMACRLILARFHKVCKTARKIDHGTDDEVVHRLRIHCKKLRYLMEFFSPLFSDSDIKPLIKALKGLQDRLGNFNDYSVQQLFIRELLPQDGRLHASDISMAESIGVLGGILSLKQRNERARIMKSFHAFDSREIHNAFNNLFHLEDS